MSTTIMIQESRLDELCTWLDGKHIPHSRRPIDLPDGVVLSIGLGPRQLSLYRRAPGANWLIVPADLVELVGHFLQETQQ